MAQSGTTQSDQDELAKQIGQAHIDVGEAPEIAEPCDITAADAVDAEPVPVG